MLLDGFPEIVVAVAATGRVTRHDYEDVLIPKVKDAFGKFAKLRVYYEIGPDFSGFDAGAVWEDFAMGMEHIRDWERIAVVTDVEWIRLAVAAFRFLIPGKVCVFEVAETTAARRWIGEA
jgi:hypothetical protein